MDGVKPTENYRPTLQSPEALKGVLASFRSLFWSALINLILQQKSLSRSLCVSRTKQDKVSSNVSKQLVSLELNKHILTLFCRLQNVSESYSCVLDICSLPDDGNMTLLYSFLLRTCFTFKSCKMFDSSLLLHPLYVF